MHCDVGGSIFPFVVALAAAVRFAVGHSAGRVVWRGWGGAQVLDRDEDPSRFDFWQNVWLAVAILFAVLGIASLGCV